MYYYLPTSEQIANILTQDLPRKQFDKLIDKHTMEDIFKATWGGVSELVIFLIFVYKLVFFSSLWVFKPTYMTTYLTPQRLSVKKTRGILTSKYMASMDWTHDLLT